MGLGPAGRALASACAARGLQVVAFDPRPDAVWRPTYGVWGDELGALPRSVVASEVADPQLRAHGRHRLGRPYVLLDNGALQAALPLDGVDVRRAALSDAEVAGLAGSDRFVVDARGARPVNARGAEEAAPAQTAFGLVVDAAAAAPALGGAEGLLMDWSTDWAPDPSRPVGVPSFLYAFGTGAGGVLLEETCLAAAPPLPIDELKARLRRRLLRRGVPADAIDRPRGREIVRIPMLGRGTAAPRGSLALGTAGRGGHVVTGYSVAHALRVAGPWADAFADGRAPTVDPRGPADLLRAAGLRALLRLDTAGTLDLFDAFGRLGRGSQRAFLSRDSAAPALAGAMWGMFARMPWSGRRALVAATLGVA